MLLGLEDLGHCPPSGRPLPRLSLQPSRGPELTSPCFHHEAQGWALYSWPCHPSTLTACMRYIPLIQQVRIHVEFLYNPQCSKSHDKTCVQPNLFSSSLTLEVFTLGRIFNHLVNLHAVLWAVLPIPRGAGLWKSWIWTSGLQDEVNMFQLPLTSRLMGKRKPYQCIPARNRWAQQGELQSIQ